MVAENIWSHFGQWWAFGLWLVFFGLFLFFTPFYKKSQIKPSSAYLAFIVALAFEMFGLPLSMYVITWLFGYTLPEGFLWGHTLVNYIGFWGMYIGIALYLIGAFLVILGWKEVHKRYWSKEEGKGSLVTNGIYAYIRHPQYTGFLLITLGMIFEWATLPLLIMWPMMVVLYSKLANREEKDMEREYGGDYVEYRKNTKRFIPFVV